MLTLLLCTCVMLLRSCSLLSDSTPARVGSDWFSPDQRNLATTIAAMSNPIGIALGQVIPTLLVDSHGGMPMLLLACAVLATATCVLTYLCMQSHPPTPPSRSTMERNNDKLELQRMLEQYPLNSPERSFWRSPLIAELRVLMSDRQFQLLLFAVGMGLGLFNSVSTLTAQLVAPSGYTLDDAGMFGALLVGCGLVGAGVVGVIMDATHAYNRMLKVGMTLAFAGTVFMLLSLRPNSYAMLVSRARGSGEFSSLHDRAGAIGSARSCIIGRASLTLHSLALCTVFHSLLQAASFGFLGGVMLPLLPVCMECAAE
jgi:sugar phosphate permease